MKKDNLLILDDQHRYWLDGDRIPGASEIMGAVFPFQSHGLASDRACQFGLAVHKAIELKLRGTLDDATVDESIIPYIKQFERWVIANGNVTPYMELKLMSKKYKFAGRLDLVTYEAVIDIVTGQKNPAHRVKTSAYLKLWNENNPKDKLDKAIDLILDGSDNMPEEYIVQPSDFSAFLACKTIYDFWKLEGK